MKDGLGGYNHRMITRRSILRGLVAAPAVVAASSLMPIRGIMMPVEARIWDGVYWMGPSNFYSYSDFYSKLPAQWDELFKAPSVQEESNGGAFGFMVPRT